MSGFTINSNNTTTTTQTATNSSTINATATATVTGPIATVYSNFGPGMSFDQNGGYVISGGFPPGDTERQTISQEFTPAGNYTFSDAKIAVSNYVGPGTLVAYLQADTNGLPGAVIETIPIDAGATGVSAAILTVNSAQSPVLQTGAHYWLTLAAGRERVNPDWNLNSIGDSSNDTFASTLSGSPLGPWHHGVGLPTRAAFEIDGAPIKNTSASSASVTLSDLLTSQASQISMSDLLPGSAAIGAQSAQASNSSGSLDNSTGANFGGLAFAGITDTTMQVMLNGSG